MTWFWHDRRFSTTAAANVTGQFLWTHPDTNGTAGVPVLPWTPPPTGQGGVALPLPEGNDGGAS